MLAKGDWKAVAPYVFLALLAFAFVSPIFKDIRNTGIDDWDQFCFFDEVPRDTILRHGQFPLWNPYYSGGRPLLANPQTGFLKPTFLFTLAFGCVIGLKIETFVMLLLGMLGMFLLMRHYRVSTIACVLSAAIFGMTSYFSLHIADGQVSFFALLLLPYAFLFFLKSFNDRKHLVFAALIIVWMLFAGGAVHIVTPLALFLGVYAVVRGLQERSARAVLHVAAIFLLAFGLAGIKTVPMLAYLADNPRATVSTDVMTPAQMLLTLAGRDQRLGDHGGIDDRWQDHGAYVGVIALALFLVGAWRFRKKELPLLVAGLAALAVTLGNIAPFAPWPLLHKLPFFESTHIPSRFVIFFVFALAVLAGMGVDTLGRTVNKKQAMRWVLLVIMLLAVADVFIVSRQPLVQAFPNVPPSIERHDVFKQEFEPHIRRAGAYSPMYYYILANVGMANGYDPIPQVTSVKWVGHPRYRGEVYLEEGGNASYEHWSSNKMVVRVSAQNATRLVINQNYDPGWKASGGKKAEPHSGLLSASVTPEDRVVTFRYRPASILAGALVSVLTIAGLVLFFRKKEMRQLSIACWIGAGIIVLLVLAHASQQAPAPITLDDCPPGNECKTCSIEDNKEVCVYGKCTDTGVCRIEIWKAVPRVRALTEISNSSRSE